MVPTERLVVIERGPGGFGVLCNAANVLVALKGRAASDAVLRVGEQVLSVDGQELGEGERLIDRIHATPEQYSFTLGVVSLTPPPPQPSLNDIMRNMIKSPAIRKMATKMATKIAMSELGSDTKLLSGAAQQKLPDVRSLHELPLQQQQLALAQQQQQQQERIEELMEQQLGAMLDSPQFGDMMGQVLESPGIQHVIRHAEAGTLCPGTVSSAQSLDSVLVAATICLLPVLAPLPPPLSRP